MRLHQIQPPRGMKCCLANMETGGDRANVGIGRESRLAMRPCCNRKLSLFLAGRVNLIGEHIDYEGYSVLPMAIKQVSSGVVKNSA